MKTGALNRITEAKNDFVPLVYVAEEIGCPLSDVFCVCIEGAVPLYVQCLDDIVDQAGVNIGRGFWVNCRVPDLIIRELVRCTEISVEQELLLAGTMTPNGSESWAQFLLIQCGPGRYTFKPANRAVTIRKRSLGVMEYHLDLVRVAIEQRKTKVESKMDAEGCPMGNDVPTINESVCPEKFTLYWLNERLFYDKAFPIQALIKLEQLQEQQPPKFRSTYALATSAGALVNHWLVNRDLDAYLRGKHIQDFAALTHKPIGCDEGESVELLQASIEIRRDELVGLMTREGLTVPKFLRPLEDQSQQSTTLTDKAFVPSPGQGERKRTSYMVTRDEIQKAFGCRDDLFRDGHAFDWFNEAKIPGRGGRNPIQPKFDPYGFAVNLPGTSYAPKSLNEVQAWRILEQHFPDRYSEVESYDPRK